MSRGCCYLCEERHFKCHTECERYLQWKNSLPKYNAVESGLMDYRKDVVNRAAKLRKEKGRWRFGG